MVLLAALSIFVLAAVSPWLVKLLGDKAGYFHAALPGGLCVYFVYELIKLASGGAPVQASVPWSEVLGLNIDTRLDGLTLLFAILVSGIGSLIMLYASSYMKGEAREPRFHAFLLSFMASMLGLVLSDNFLLIFVFWELTSITSFLLIGWYHEKEESRTAAWQALLTTGLGGLAMLAGLVMIGIAGGSFSFSQVVNSPEAIEAIRTSPMLPGILICTLLGCFTKSAQFPFHYWLPNAMAGPTPVSAYLHSSTMVKAGVFLIAKLNPIFEGIPWWSDTLWIVGGFTMILTAYLGSRQYKLKSLLAYSTVLSLALMIMLIGLGSKNHYALYGAMGYLLAHALFKATLFMVAGTLTHETGTKEVEKLSGLRKALPFTAFAGGLAALSMCGVPGFFGFTAKEFALKATLEHNSWGTLAMILVVAVTFIAAIWNALIALSVGVKPFFGKFLETPKHAHEAPWRMWIGPCLLAVLGGVAGLAPGLFAAPMVDQAAKAVKSQVGGSHDGHKYDDKYQEHAAYDHATGIGYVLVPIASEPHAEESHGGDAHTDGQHKAGYADSHKDEKHSKHKAMRYDLPYLLTPGSSQAWAAFILSLLALVGGVFFLKIRKQWRAMNAPLAKLEKFGPEATYFKALNGTIGFARWQTGKLQSGYLGRYVLITIGFSMVLVIAALVRGVNLPAVGELAVYHLSDPSPLDGVLIALIIVGGFFTTIFKSRLAAVASLGLVGYAVALVFVVYGAPDVAMTQFAIETLTVIIFVLVLYHLPTFAKLSNKVSRTTDIIVASVFGVVMMMMALLATEYRFLETTNVQPISAYFAEWSYKSSEGIDGGLGKNVVNVILVDFRGFDTLGEILVLGIASVGVYTLMKVRAGKPYVPLDITGLKPARSGSSSQEGAGS